MTGPATPSALSPRRRCQRLSARSVCEPNTPSADTPSLRCRADTPPPRERRLFPARLERLSAPRRLSTGPLRMPSARRVAGPAMPSATKPCERCQRLSARSVCGPKTPSAGDAQRALERGHAAAPRTRLGGLRDVRSLAQVAGRCGHRRARHRQQRCHRQPPLGRQRQLSPLVRRLTAGPREPARVAPQVVVGHVPRYRRQQVAGGQPRRGAVAPPALVRALDRHRPDLAACKVPLDRAQIVSTSYVGTAPTR